MFNRIVLLLVLILTLVGCRSREVEQNNDGTATITIGLIEDEINSIITNALNNAENPLLSDPVADLQVGQIVVSGEHDLQDGSGNVPASITLQVSVVNGSIQSQVVQADIEGWDASDERIQQMNEQLATRLAEIAREENANASFDSINITDNILEIAIIVPVEATINE